MLMRKFIILCVMVFCAIGLPGRGRVPQEANGDTACLPGDTLRAKVYRLSPVDSVLFRQEPGYDKHAVRFERDAFKEKMKEPWLGDFLKDILFR